MATLEEFMRTSHLGPVILGMSSSDVLVALDDPDSISKKSNPLIFTYGCIQLTFWKAFKGGVPELREIVLSFEPFKPPPEFLEITDWNPQEPPTEQDFRSLILRIEYPPVHVVEGPSEKAFMFPSGVSALVADGRLHSIRLQQKESKATPLAPVVDDRESSLEQIHSMLLEAEYVAAAGAIRAALLIGWAALEATSRRLSLREGRQGKVGVHPLILLRELFASGQLNAEDHRMLEMLRQQRMAAAHGLGATDLDAKAVDKLIKLTFGMLERLEQG
jgi:hypothetical protein